MSSRSLSDREHALLDFERDWSSHEGGKLSAINATFGISPSRYYQLLADLINDDAAIAVDPLLIRRLRRRRLARLDRVAPPVPTDQRGRGLTK